MVNGRKSEPTGAMWLLSPADRAERLQRIIGALRAEYGLPRHGNPTNPVDDLVYITLSNRTGSQVANQVYAAVRREFPQWDEVLASPPETLSTILQPAGLSAIKAAFIRGQLSRLLEDFGTVTLGPVASMSVQEAEQYLCGLPGVSLKVAKCVMMYTLGFHVLPVDTHVFRICKRIGLTARKRADQSHEDIEPQIPPGDRYAFHVDAISHGRKVCLPRAPRCGDCGVRPYCDFGRR